MLDWLASGLWSAAIHWLAYWSVGVLIIGGGIAAAWFSPLFKEAFVGISIGAGLLMAADNGLVSFKPKDPGICEHPATDPNGPTVPMCWIKTDDRGYGYWEPCK